ncbi:ShKT domain-containing protein [Caenorhabditis elegans]|uniref:ShKT domain-containing protein n=1 Tax=Caenorhabditis elegans TaxID=6239 RepID=A6ZJ60_CAEEL|nr:ShKT domain-containing protein [Caenorhabditis elegans]CAO78723.1 ShKT domain-containing protein [Caenorhabditis elegans]|eukprot:NP_001123167.1 Uncharacterized protein CELE_M153.5 [Caenorhabditis elegans]
MLFSVRFFIVCTTSVSLLSAVAQAGYTPNFNFNQPHDISGRTPCCVDRLTTLTCGRMRLNTPAKFAKRCANDPDFALIQCCSSCFDRRSSLSSEKYNLVVRRHLEDPMKATCIDRRGGDWCQKMANRENYWQDASFSTIGGCGAFPSAFRECRNTCGYCSATMQMTVVKYDYRLATSTPRCDIKTYFARTDVEMKKRYNPAKKEFDPLARLIWKRPKDTDYFVVEDHNYEDFM